LDEVNDIAKAAGYNVVGQVTQHREAIDAAYSVGEGRLDEISKTIGKDSIEVLISLICINKVDITPREHLDKVLEETRKIFETGEIMEISAKTGTKIPDLLQKIAERLSA
jgi:50S ribosomal subunit-associated GTPase HflX